jgi:4-hydroxy-tetrahydrodipicolinate synthase
MSLLAQSLSHTHIHTLICCFDCQYPFFVPSKMSIRQGSTVALITPFHEDTGKVDYNSLQNLIQYHIESGTDNLCLLGTTGEAGVLSMTERQQILTTAVNMVKGQIPIMVGCGTINPQHVQDMIQQATDCGADAALVVTPYYVKPPQRSLIRHYTTLADISPIPLIIYNVPGRTAVDMTDESIAIAGSHTNIIGVKDATGKLERLQLLQEQLIQQQNVNPHNDFLLFSGDDETSMEYVYRGGDGCISVTANIAAKSMHDIMMAALHQKDYTMAQALNEPLIVLHQKLFCESNPMPIKYAASKLKLIQTPYCRPPLDVMDMERYGTIVDNALQKAGLLL